MNSVTVGCQYRLAPTYLSLYQNMHGRKGTVAGGAPGQVGHQGR